MSTFIKMSFPNKSHIAGKKYGGKVDIRISEFGVHTHMHRRFTGDISDGRSRSPTARCDKLVTVLSTPREIFLLNRVLNERRNGITASTRQEFAARWPWHIKWQAGN